MPTFLFTATGPNGTTVTDRIEQPTLSAAKYTLELRGYKDLQFHTDDIAAQTDNALMAEFEAKLPKDVLTPEQELRARRGGGVLREIWFAWKLNSLFWVPLFAWSAIAIHGGRPFGWGDWCAFLLTIAFLIYFFWLVLPAIAYQRLLDAGVHFQWDEVRRWAGVIRLLKRTAFVPIPEFEIDFRVAYGLAAENKLEEALRLTKKYEDHSCGKFQYFSRLAGLYEAARDFPKMTHCRRLAAEHGSGKPEEKLDLAMGLLRRERKPTEAKALLDEIDLSDCGDLVVLFCEYCRGLLAFELGDCAAAEAYLRKTIDLSKPYENNPLMAGMLMDIRAYLSLALAGLGQLPQAKALLDQAEPLLRIRREDELIQRCRAALGIA
jgi:hypothetical protein